ncbi:hypothetical protein KQ247_03910 [Ruegeria pomeroyi]|jgi:hypothetical protein|uniref:Lipoprotein n=2 Tax=Ruegeria pomeroyi TaxID=89184 RepID=V5V0K9_RUEPO|nr:hypothetical protein [Ruegeria pomeroyi]AHB86029.1 hypothetical protein SPO2973a [Ruegeria pomeroyi DSS-3]NVK96473.1 hypothetical protein [Ruegeria pomeroyi]NVL01109.1 hypothetical protein [Ruegeria pomeroyi]QWV09761.1 hypothetical protein KQ247_03910 [Ruegeria pomeroyi]
MTTHAKAQSSFFKPILTLMAFAFLTACATSETVEKSGSQAGVSQVFDAPISKVVSSAETVLEKQGLNITKSTVAQNEAVIIFSKPVSAFSWGEVGKLTFTSVAPDKTQAFITTQRRGTLNVTAKSEAAFAREIFGGIQSDLSGS